MRDKKICDSKFHKPTLNSLLEIPLLGLVYRWENGNDTIVVGPEGKIMLSQASSGVQSVVPAHLILYQLENDPGKWEIIVEEPELNLFPTKQKAFLEYLVKVTNRTQSKLFITTHSPYILSSLENLIQAQEAYRKRPEQKGAISQIIEEDRWVDFDRVTTYFFDAGTCRSTLDPELRSLGPAEIDAVSDILSEDLNELVKIEYAERLFKFNTAILLRHLFLPLFSYFLIRSLGCALQNELRLTKKSAITNFTNQF
ncbi:MAG: AAA family ATPase [Bacteroidota bacterium]